MYSGKLRVVTFNLSYHSSGSNAERIARGSEGKEGCKAKDTHVVDYSSHSSQLTGSRVEQSVE